MFPWSSLACAASGFLTLLVSGSALAADGISIEWEAPATCPTAEQVESEVRAMLSEDLSSQTQLAATGRIEREEPGWSLKLRIEADSGVLERELRDADCKVLGEVAALYIALAIDPGAALSSRSSPPTQASEALEPETKAPPPEPSVADPPEVEARASTPERPEASPRQLAPPHRWSLGVASAATVVVLPRAAVDLSLRATWERGFLGAELAGFADLPRTIHYDDPSDAGANVYVLGAGAGFCPAYPGRRWRIGGCMGIETGRLVARGVGVASAETRTSPWLSANAGLRISWDAGRTLRLFALADLLVPLIRPGVAVAGLPELFRVSALGARTGLGVAFAWPDRR